MDHYITIQPKEDVMHTTTANPLTAKKTLNLPAVRTERNLRRANKNKKSKARPSRSPLGSLSSSNANALEKRDANQKVQQWANATKRVLQRTDHLVQSVMSRYTSTTDVDQFIKKASSQIKALDPKLSSDSSSDNGKNDGRASDVESTKRGKRSTFLSQAPAQDHRRRNKQELHNQSIGDDTDSHQTPPTATASSSSPSPPPSSSSSSPSTTSSGADPFFCTETLPPALAELRTAFMPEVSPERMLKVQTELDASRAKCWAIQLKAEQDESTISTLRTALGLALPQADMLQVELHALLQKNKDLAAEKEALESAFNHVYLLKTVTDKESDELGHEKAALEGANMALQAYIAEYKREKESYIAEILDDALPSYEDYTLEDMEQGRHYEEFADECKRLNVNTSPIVTGASGAWNTNKRKRVSNQIQSLNLKIASYKKAKTSTPGNRDVEGNFLMDMHVKEVASKEKELSEASTAITELIKINRSLTAEIARMCTRHRHQLLDSAYRRQEDAIKAREVREKWHAFNRSKIHGLEAQITRGYQSSAHHITSLQSRISALEQNNKVLEQDKIHLQGQLLAQNSSPISSSPALRRK